jgi:hypothetical protein
MPRQAAKIPPALMGLSARSVRAFQRDWQEALASPSLDGATRYYLAKIGPSQAAAGWLAGYLAHSVKRRRSRWPSEPR